MNKLGFLGIALIGLIGLSATFLILKSENELSQRNGQLYFQTVDAEMLAELLEALSEVTNDRTKLVILGSFMHSQHRFFTADQISQVFQFFGQDHSSSDLQYPRKEVIEILKPYIAPLNTQEAMQLLSQIQNFDGISQGILISQIYDLADQTNLQQIKSFISSYGKNFINQELIPQSEKVFYNDFLITTEGKHAGFLIDQSASMNAVAFTNQDGTVVTRYDLLKQFFYNRSDILQNFFAFSYRFVGEANNSFCESCFADNYDEVKGFSISTYNILAGKGESNIYAKLQDLLSSENDYLSDVFILSDGIITQGTSHVHDFLDLINNSNEFRRSKLRINTISFLVGGNESQEQRQNATELLQTIADQTGGAFFQITA